MGKQGGMGLAVLMLLGIMSGAQAVAAKPKARISPQPAVQTSTIRKQPAKKSPQGRQTAKKKKSPSRSLIQVIKRIFKAPIMSSTLGTRHNLCAITGRLGDTYVLWSNQPVFAWRGKAKELQLLDEDTEVILWQKSISEEARSLSYDGPALEPGKIYEWRLLNAGQVQPSTFQVMTNEQRLQIATDLKHISDADITEAFSDNIRIALAQANYFGNQKGLWSDSLQVLYAVEEPSKELTVALNALSEELCGGSANSTHEKPETVSMP